MTKSIFEYKDEQDWYLASFGSYNQLTCFGGDEAYEQYVDFFQGLTNALAVSGFQLHIVKHSSDLRLVSFILDSLKENTGRDLAVTQHQGALLVSEGEKLVYVHVPKEGVALEDFFGSKSQSTFGDVLLIATRNEGKTKEFRKLFGKLGITVENLNDYPDLPEVAETGTTFEENARLKAETISELTGKMVLSDDSGLKVDILGGLPGVWSARFAGPDATDAENNAKLLHELAMVLDDDKRSAQFHTTLVVAAPGRDSLVVEADWEGYIGREPKGDNGFGYDPLFLVGETGKTAAELSSEEKNEQSHRGQAVKKLMEVFPAWEQSIIVMSDSHGDRDIVEDIKKRYQGKVDAIFHNGDSELESSDPVWDGIYVVRGNCDYDSGYPERLVVKLGDVIIAQTHGHLYGINFTWDKLDLWAQQEDADICLYGHLHAATAWRNGKTVFINPGSVSQPRGPINVKLYAKVLIDNAKIRVEYYTRDHELYPELTQEFER